MSIYEEIKECVACGSTNLNPLLDLGVQPLANSFLRSKDQTESVYPLATKYCGECHHVQLTHKVHPDLLFKDYLYVSGTSKTMQEYFDWFASFVVDNRYNKDRLFNILDIGCNDGSQLDAFKRLEEKNYGDIRILTRGVDPAENLYPVSSQKHDIHCGYFDDDCAHKLRYSFDAVICQNAFAHNYDQLQFLMNMKKVINHDCYIYIVTSQADMIMNSQFDTIYHEHISFYNVKSMNALCRRAGLNLIEVLKHPIHGNSYIFVIAANRSRISYVDLCIEEETLLGLYNDATYAHYIEDCKEIIEAFAQEVIRLKSEGKVLIGYGAPAKGNTLLNASFVTLDFIIDDNPLKQNMFTPGMRIPVYSSEKLKEYAEADNLVFVPLAWNFFEEIKTKIETMRPHKRDAFLRYFPYVYTEQTQ